LIIGILQRTYALLYFNICRFKQTGIRLTVIRETHIQKKAIGTVSFSYFHDICKV
jgi:hypothetical protein